STKMVFMLDGNPPPPLKPKLHPPRTSSPKSSARLRCMGRPDVRCERLDTFDLVQIQRQFRKGRPVPVDRFPRETVRPRTFQLHGVPASAHVPLDAPQAAGLEEVRPAFAIALYIEPRLIAF